MSVETPGNEGGALVARVKAIILRPKEEWPVIERETTPSGEIFMRYAVPLAAIGPVAQFIGSQVFGYSAFGVSIRPSFATSLSLAISGFVLSLIGLFVISFVADRLAPKFGGEQNARNAFKLVVYSTTANWLASVFSIVPALGVLSILGFYAFYLFWAGAHPLMKVRPDKALTYTIVTLVCVILVYIVIGALTAGLGRIVAGPSAIGGFGGLGGSTVGTGEGASVSIPGVGTIDTGKIEQAAREAQVASTREAAAPADLQALLPGSIGSYRRTAIESSKAGPASRAEATYEAGDRRFTLQVSDIAMMGAMAGMAGALGVEGSKEDGDSYERTSSVDGNLTVEKWNRSSARGSYMTMVGKRFMVEAEGDAASIDELKAAVAAVDRAALAALAGG
jgi:hypothetical protein